MIDGELKATAPDMMFVDTPWTVAMALRPAPEPAGATQRRDVMDSHWVDSQTDDPILADTGTGTGPKPSPNSVMVTPPVLGRELLEVLDREGLGMICSMVSTGDCCEATVTTVETAASLNEAGTVLKSNDVSDIQDACEESVLPTRTKTLLFCIPKFIPNMVIVSPPPLDVNTLDSAVGWGGSYENTMEPDSAVVAIVLCACVRV